MRKPKIWCNKKLHKLEETGVPDKDGVRRCFPCKKEQRRIWESKNKQRLRNNDARFRQSLTPEEKEKRYAQVRKLREEKDYSSIYRLERYGLTKEEYQQLCVQSKGLCMICFTNPDNRKLSIDHNHVSGKVRGLLCRRCNAVLDM